MTQAFLLSIRLHVLWFSEAFSKRGRELTPLGWRRLGGLILVFPLFFLLQLLHWLGFFLDEVFFRGYRQVAVKNPLFITGIPRSGGTVVHWTLSRDSSQFTTMSTWEALLTPSITGRKVIQTLARIDRCIGRPGGRLFQRLYLKILGPRSQLKAKEAPEELYSPEEDYLTLLPAAGCFSLILAFPASRSLWQLGRFQEVPEDQRAILVNYYKSCIKKHLYFRGVERRFLSKNAAFGSWLPDLRLAFPDAHYLVCVREPNAALSSQLSAIVPGLQFFDTVPASDTYSLELQTVMAHAYRILLDETKSFLIDHLAIIDHEELIQNTRTVLRNAFAQLGIPLTESLVMALEEVAQQPLGTAGSRPHVPFPGKAGPAEFRTLVTAIYQQILERPYLRRRSGS